MKHILFLTEGDNYQACARIRATQYFPYLEDAYKLKHIARIKDKRDISFKNAIISDLIFKFTKQFRLIYTFSYILFSATDLVFIQRWKLPNYIISIIKLKKLKVIFDFDDAIYQGHEKKVVQLIQLSKAIITSNQELTNYCKNYTEAPIYIITSPVDTNTIKPQHKANQRIKIGWIGSPSTVKYLKAIEPVFIKLSQSCDFELVIVGAYWQQSNLYHSQVIQWSLENEIKTLSQIDIGIMPLDNSEWAKNKGGYKLFLYMAAGLPIVGSPVGINETIIEPNINGYGPINEQEWIDCLATLIQNPSLRYEMGKNSREKCIKHYSYEYNATQLVSIIKSII